jgi:hypothetical protein
MALVISGHDWIPEISLRDSKMWWKVFAILYNIEIKVKNQTYRSSAGDPELTGPAVVNHL